MPLSGWRAAYTGDALGWHDRARTHFNAYAASQVTEVPNTIPHPAQDSTLALARSEKKWGTPQYSNGYICRNPRRNDQMHHYDMNLCYIDELLWHFNWTGDLEYARRMWPVLTRHLAWENETMIPIMTDFMMPMPASGQVMPFIIIVVRSLILLPITIVPIASQL